MTVEEALQAAMQLGRDLSSHFSDARVEPVELPDEPFSSWYSDWRNHVPQEGSGVYLFVRPNGEVIYIGKADNASFGTEIWGKMRKPGADEDGTPEFDQCKFLADYYDAEDDVLEELRRGDVRFAVATVTPSDLTSTVETFLQAKCCIEGGGLPAFNLRIG